MTVQPSVVLEHKLIHYRTKGFPNYGYKTSKQGLMSWVLGLAPTHTNSVELNRSKVLSLDFLSWSA